MENKLKEKFDRILIDIVPFYGSNTDDENFLDAMQQAYELGKQEANEWIDVNDMLPEIWKPVLVWYDGEEIITAELTEEKTWANKSISWFIHSDDVTHWQPLPTQPNQ